MHCHEVFSHVLFRVSSKFVSWRFEMKLACEMEAANTFCLKGSRLHLKLQKFATRNLVLWSHLGFVSLRFAWLVFGHDVGLKEANKRCIWSPVQDVWVTSKMFEFAENIATRNEEAVRMHACKCSRKLH